MKIVKSAQAGSLESCDILISIEPGKQNSGVVIKLESPALKQFGEVIKQEILEVVKRFDVTDVTISAIDKGALTYCIKARTETVLKRASGE